MTFNSIQYVIFLLITAVLYRVFSEKFSAALLLLASYVFYLSFNPSYALLLAALSIISYFNAILIEENKNGKKKTRFVFCMLATTAVLFFYKYLNFAIQSIISLLKMPVLPINSFFENLILPVGISFYTFQIIAYLADVYNGRIKAERNFITYALFISFFPQILSGPIARTYDVLPQLQQKQHASVNDIKSGILIFIWGLYKKMVIADNLAVIVNNAYGNITDNTGMQLAFASICYSFQIYCDFSAYSDMAIASAKFFGINLSRNFNAPYLSSSIKDFWRKWHISLSTWFKDYIYIPLGGNRKGRLIQYRNILIVFLVSGLWHGANWTFIVWGLLHGIVQIAESLISLKQKPEKTKNKSNCLITLLQTGLTFAITNILWIFFRADNLTSAAAIIKKIFLDFGPADINLFAAMGQSKVMLGVMFICIMILIVADILISRKDILNTINSTVFPRYAICFILIIIIMFVGYYGEGYDPQDFVYFKF